MQGSKGVKLKPNCTGGDITSDGGVMLLRAVDKRLNLTARVAELFEDTRCKDKVRHPLLPMLRQRIYGIALGYEDLNDHQTLRKDKMIQTAVERDRDLASSSTLCCFENRTSYQVTRGISRMQVEVFIESFKTAPKELILDFDSTDDPVHGEQLEAYFHGYYDHHCFLPLYVFCGEKLLVSYLRPSNIDNAKHAWAILSLLVKRLRHAWPDVHIIFRDDSGFCRHKMFNWNPAYTEVSKIVFSHSGFALRDVHDEKLAIVVLRKNEQYAYPEEPFRLDDST
jgi:hypothetical protein